MGHRNRCEMQVNGLNLGKRDLEGQASVTRGTVWPVTLRGPLSGQMLPLPHNLQPRNFPKVQPVVNLGPWAVGRAGLPPGGL